MQIELSEEMQVRIKLELLNHCDEIADLGEAIDKLAEGKSAFVVKAAFGYSLGLQIFGATDVLRVSLGIMQLSAEAAILSKRMHEAEIGVNRVNPTAL